MRTIALQAGSAVALLCVALWAPSAHAYPMYDDGAGNGCVSCHNQFQGGNGVLHVQHRNLFGVTTCNLCHPSGGGSTPVRTYTSGSGGGFGCAGCHGQNYGEISPNSGNPKATAYGLRLVHVANGVTACGNSGCHQPGSLGHPNPFPAVFPESVAPPYFAPAFSSLTDPCSSTEEDIPFDADALGLDNDGNGFRDFPADPNCSGPATTTTTTTPSTTTTTTLPFTCSAAPIGGCVAPAKAVLLISEKTVGKEKLKVTLTKLLPLVTPAQFGNPVSGSTKYNLCVYDAANQLRGEYNVARAGDTCGTRPCWAPVSTKGYKYLDKSTVADGILNMTLLGGDAGKGKIKVIGKNLQGAMPTGVALMLQNQTSATVQLQTSDADCFGASLPTVKTADGLIFSAIAP